MQRGIGRAVNPTQKPLALLRQIIKASSKEGDMVLAVVGLGRQSATGPCTRTGSTPYSGKNNLTAEIP